MYVVPNLDISIMKIHLSGSKPPHISENLFEMLWRNKIYISDLQKMFFWKLQLQGKSNLEFSPGRSCSSRGQCGLTMEQQTDRPQFERKPLEKKKKCGLFQPSSMSLYLDLEW